MKGGAEAPTGAAPVARLWLARHGQTAYNAEGRFQGWAPVPLDETGRAQAAELATVVQRLAPAMLVTSNIARAQETAAIVAEQVGITPVVDDRFAETDAGDWTDCSFADVLAEDPDSFARFAALDMTWGFPGGESFTQQRERVAAGLADWRGRGIAGNLVIVCHGNVIRLATADLGEATPGRPENGSLVGL